MGQILESLLNIQTKNESFLCCIGSWLKSFQYIFLSDAMMNAYSTSNDVKKEYNKYEWMCIF